MIITVNWEKVLIGVIGLGVMVRLINFGTNPISLNRDEAALGYNAYTIAQYGTDEWGYRLPLTFISFGDYKLPGYIYSLVPLIKVFGVHDWVIRFPSLLAGLGILMAVYLLSKLWFEHKLPALLATALIATAPFAIFYSRMAYEANLGLMWLLWTGYLITLPFKAKRLPLIALSYSLAVLTYNTPLLLAPLVVFYIGWRYRQQPAAGSLIAVIIIIIAVISFGLLSPLTAQKQQITIFNDPTLQAQWREEYAHAQSPWEQKWASQPSQIVRYSLKKLGETVAPNFMVLKGGSHPWHGIGDNGVIGWVQYILFLSSLLIGQKAKRQRLLIIIGLGISLWPAIVTVDSPHVTRSLLFLVLTAPVAAKITSGWHKMISLVVGAMILELATFSYQYFVFFPNQMHSSWPKGLETAISRANSILPPNQIVEVTNRKNLTTEITADQPYIYVALYNQLKPTLNWSEQEKDSAGMVRVKSLDRYRFTNDDSTELKNSIRIERSADGWYRLLEG